MKGGEWLGLCDIVSDYHWPPDTIRRRIICYLGVADNGFPQVTETAESKTMDKGELLYFICDLLWEKIICQQIIFYKMGMNLKEEIILCLSTRLMGLLREKTSLEILTSWIRLSISICCILLLLFTQEISRNYLKSSYLITTNILSLWNIITNPKYNWPE